MKFVMLGRGKTGSLVADIARQRGHQVVVLGASDNPNGATLNAKTLAGVDTVIDFTIPDAVLHNIEACARARVSMVVGTTGWYGELARVRRVVEESGIGFVYASNFSVGVNLFFDVAELASRALKLGYAAHIVEKHHVHKKDVPSGTAVSIRKLLGDEQIKIESVREGEIVGYHAVTLESPNDTITLEHDAKSRRGFAEGAVFAAEWVAGKKGFYEFRETLK